PPCSRRCRRRARGRSACRRGRSWADCSKLRRENSRTQRAKDSPNAQKKSVFSPTRIIRYYHLTGSSTLRHDMTKFVFVTGGVVSSLGKGIASASLAAILESRGLKVTLIKLDPYINVDPGTMSPFQHGEVFVTDDGAETDLDLGDYERFITTKMKKTNNFTTGQIYKSV